MIMILLPLKPPRQCTNHLLVSNEHVLLFLLIYAKASLQFSALLSGDPRPPVNSVELELYRLQICSGGMHSYPGVVGNKTPCPTFAPL
jgi:hypothetical protein